MTHEKTTLEIIEIHPDAPPKPDFGSPCNGCGVCCAAEPCPVAMVFLFQRRGRCRALLWHTERARYVCGMVACPERYLFFLPDSLSKMFGKIFARKIASGIGCDSTIETHP